MQACQLVLFDDILVQMVKFLTLFNVVSFIFQILIQGFNSSSVKASFVKFILKIRIQFMEKTFCFQRQFQVMTFFFGQMTSYYYSLIKINSLSQVNNRAFINQMIIFNPHNLPFSFYFSYLLVLWAQNDSMEKLILHLSMVAEFTLYLLNSFFIFTY